MQGRDNNLPRLNKDTAYLDRARLFTLTEYTVKLAVIASSLIYNN